MKLEELLKVATIPDGCKACLFGCQCRANNVERLSRATYPLDVIPELIIEIE